MNPWGNVAEKKYLFTTSDKAAQRIMPTNPVIRHHNLIVAIDASTFARFSEACCAEMVLTPLRGMPRLVRAENMSVVRLSTSVMPIPTRPINNAAHLLRTTEISTWRTCTPPKRPVYFKILP